MQAISFKWESVSEHCLGRDILLLASKTTRWCSSLAHIQGPDYRLYKSEPELTTVAEVDESNGEEKAEPLSESETSATKG